MKLHDLDQTTRKHSLQEIERDLKDGVIYASPRLTSLGKEKYSALLKTALDIGTPESFAVALQEHMRETESRNGKTVKVPSNAHKGLAEGEFNRYYIRGLCLRAIEQKVKELEIYRAKEVSEARPGSEARIGKMADPEKLLADLRKNIGVETALKVPSGPNSGMSVRIPLPKK